MENWGWTSYKKTGWNDEEGRKMYRAIFMTEQLIDKQSGKSVFRYKKCTVDFLAKRPILALRKIIDTCKVFKVNPWEFEGKAVN